MRDQVKETIKKSDYLGIAGMNLKLYVWEDVLLGSSYGIAFALAKDVHQARELLRKKMAAGDYGEELHADLRKDPQIISEPEGFYVWGGD